MAFNDDNRLRGARGTAARYASINPIVYPGEYHVEYDSGRAKFGNNELTAYNLLPYAGDMVRVSSITEMKALPVRAKQVYSVAGSQGGLFYYDSSDTSTAEDGGMVFVSGTKRFKRIYDDYALSVKWFGAVGSGSVDDQPAIQNAVNWAIANGVKRVFFPSGNYRIDAPIILYKLNAGAYAFFNLDLVGSANANAAVTNQSSRIVPSFSNTFAIGLQNARSCTIDGLYIVGLYTYSKTVKQIFEQDRGSWTVSGCRDELNSPYCGIVVDPFSTSLPPDGGYPGLSSFYKASAAGSSAVTVQNCYISNFVLGFGVSIAQGITNAENINLYRTRIYTTRVATAYGQPQTRANTIRDCAIFSCFNVIDTNSYGDQIGSAPDVDVLNVSTVKNILNIDTARGVFKARGIEAEAFWKIGVIGGTKGAAFYSCIFKFQYGAPGSNYAKAPDTLAGGQQSWITFYNCDFNKAGDTPWNANFNGTNTTFYDCAFDTTFIPYMSDQANCNRLLKNCRIGNIIIDEGFDRRYITSNGFGIMGTGTLSKSIGLHVLETLSEGGLSMGSGTLTIAANGDSTATFVVADNSGLKVGDMVYASGTPATFYYIQRDGYNSNTESQITNPFIGTIASIVGTTITIKDIPYYVITGTYTLITRWSNVYYGAMVGTVTSGSNVITNVYQENSGVNYVGKRIIATGIPTGAYVVSEDKGARTLTLSEDATSSVASTFLYTAAFKRRISVSGDPAATSGYYFATGDMVESGASRYICTQTGISGNGTHPPTFSTITTS